MGDQGSGLEVIMTMLRNNVTRKHLVVSSTEYGGCEGVLNSRRGSAEIAVGLFVYHVGMSL